MSDSMAVLTKPNQLLPVPERFDSPNPMLDEPLQSILKSGIHPIFNPVVNPAASNERLCFLILFHYYFMKMHVIA
jgi:hypothetical protein